jgi:hypothetical protein
MNITKGRLKQIIQEELSRVKEGPVIQGHEPEEPPIITVTEEELIEARHVAYHLIKDSLESGADAGSLLATVVKVYGGTGPTATTDSVPSHILELFPDVPSGE